MAADPSRLGSTFGGALVGMLLATSVKGALIGFDQTGSGWGWLSVPVGAVSGPFLLFPDLLVLTGTGDFSKLVVLPWAVAGTLIGGWAGYSSARSAA